LSLEILISSENEIDFNWSFSQVAQCPVNNFLLNAMFSVLLPLACLLHSNCCLFVCSDSEWLISREFPRLSWPSAADTELYHTHCLCAWQRQTSSGR